MPEIIDIVETTEKAPILLGWQWLALTIVIILIITAITAFKKHASYQTKNPNHLKKALEELRIIQQNIEKNKLPDNTLTTELSLITREYLQGKFKNKAIFQTHQEFITDHKDLEKIPEQARHKLSSYLSILAKHKYTPDNNLPPEKNKLILQTESLLKGIDSTTTQSL